jgi:hypothetical protein
VTLAFAIASPGGVLGKLYTTGAKDATIINVGPRPVRISSLNGTYKQSVAGRQHFIVSTRNLPHILDEQPAVDEYFDLTDQFVNRKRKHTLRD